MARLLGAAAKSVEAAGAGFLLICTNTMHKVAPQIEQAISIPLLHIADATAEQLVRDRISCVGLLGTQFTMEQDFYKRRLTEKFGIKVVIPDAGDRELVHEVIYDELCMGKITVNSRSSYLHIIDKLKQHGAEAVVLGCTEIALLVQQAHTPVPLYDTTEIHAQQAIRYALAD